MVNTIYYSVIIQIKMSFKNTRRMNRSISPLGEKNTTPDLQTKFPNIDTTLDSNPHYNFNAPSLKEFSESPGTYQAKPRNYFRDEDHVNGSLAEINLELDNNMNQIIFLLGKRKHLTHAKRRKLKEEMEQKLNDARNCCENNFEYLHDEQFAKIVQFCPNVDMSVKIISKIIKILPEMRGPRADEEEKSESFWNRNKEIENQVDDMLAKLKSIENNLEKENFEVIEICKTLDHVEDKLKAIAGTKADDHLQKVQPLFNSKKKHYDQLNAIVNERERIKDKKIQVIKHIKELVSELRATRESRLHEIAQFFGVDNICDFDKFNFKEAGDFGSGFEELMKIREKEGYLELSEKDSWTELDRISYEQEELYSNILKKQSDEAKAFHEYTKVMSQRIKYTSILSIFGSEEEHHQMLSENPADIFRKFKQYKGFLKRFIEEDGLIKQGLVKTKETSQTFDTLLKVTENEKQRRHEVLSLLETCLRKRGDYEHKKQQIRNLMVQMTKNEQELGQFEEELEGILSDGDINAYKSIGKSISFCEEEKCRLLRMKERLEKEMESMDREVVGLANRIQGQYEDILREIIPSDYELSLKSSDDVKKLRNHLRKMYKRLGILKNQ